MTRDHASTEERQLAQPERTIIKHDRTPGP
jgi:hypothetical protein